MGSTTDEGSVEWPRSADTLNQMSEIVKARYLRLMELVSYGYTWDDACLLADAPVSLRCILETVVPATRVAVAV